MPPKRKRSEQDTERLSLGAKIDLLGDVMPVPFDRLKRALDKARDERESARQALRASMSRLERAEKQTSLLERRGALMLHRKAQTVEDLEEIERLETSRRAGDAADPEAEGGDRHAKRLRGESSADTSVGPTNVGSPGAGSAAPPETSEPVDFARMPVFWEVDPFSGEFDVSALDGLDFGGGIL
ncbi:uncharacterized protein K452DRAFT_294741 [Aplosporella prunicola CBS 121167]|uniref:Uncharacterized protein n=1 Tax=Aplosporella prunicola CBS 121167 TaxID=1176127 RepID=A0A6A6BPW8_9PEZI|nr:uncharacterized protein K452DRAFT_294741 [Aplosporella prunicola CBS 121167]KAF2146136.1 hypothetical protein K452DRAFT_294741 [Aplosporella prunicola CBS 121167]